MTRHIVIKSNRYWHVTLLWLLCLCNVQAKELIDIEVASPYLDLHTGPGRGYPVFFSVERGETITLERKRTSWVKVKTRRGATGWATVADLSSSVQASDYDLGIDSGADSDSGSPRQRDFSQQRWKGGFFLGDFNGATAIHGYAGYSMTEHLSTEIHLTQAIGEFSDSKLVAIHLRHTLFPTARLTPYFALGAGVINTSPDATLVQTQDRNNTLMLARLGGELHITRNYQLSLEYANYTILTNRNNNEEVEEWKFGINVFF